MRVLQVLAGARHGGAETFFVTLCEALARAGVEQRAAIRRHPERAAALEAAGLTVSQMSFGGPLDVLTPRHLAALTRDWRPEVVLSWMSRASAFMPRGQFLKLARLGGYYDLKYFRKCDHLLCIAPDIMRHCREAGWPAERVHYAPNFAKVEPLTDPTRRRRELREELSTPEDAPLLIALGRLHHAKAFDVLFHSLAEEKRAHLWIAGEGPDRAKLESLAFELKLAERVRFLGWRNDRPDLFAAADICVFPSRYEPFGTVTLEAWGYRRPLIAAAAAGPAGVVRPEEDALLVPIEDAPALAKAIARLIDEPATAARLVEAGHRRYEESFTEAACVARYQELFSTLRRAGR